MTNETQTILVTGSSSGFGRLMAQTLAEAGHHVFASMRGIYGKNADRAVALTHWARREGLKLEVVELDVTDQPSIDKVVGHILRMAGRIDVVVNNAGTLNVGVLEGFTLDQVEALFDVNTFGALRVDKAVLPSMRERGAGLLIHITSTGGRVLVPYVSPYSAAKAALEALAEEFNFQLTPFGVESIIVEPGAYGTEAVDKVIAPADDDVLAGYGAVAALPQQMFAGMAAALAQPGAPDPQEVADAVAALVAMPAGQRPLRTVVGSQVVAGVESLNRAYDASKAEMLAEMGAGAPAEAVPV